MSRSQNHRFVPELETLDARIAPGSLRGGVVGPEPETSATTVVVTRMHIGEEIPQMAPPGTVDLLGGRGGIGGEF